MLKRWEDLPAYMQTAEVRPYYEILSRKKGQLALKRGFDLAAGSVLTVLLALPMAAIAIAIKADSEGPVFYRQAVPHP